jgi:hypothetical protein
MSQDDAARARFEEWAVVQEYDLRRSTDRFDAATRANFPDALYVSGPTNEAWTAWQASAREERKRIAFEMRDRVNRLKRCGFEDDAEARILNTWADRIERGQ